MQHKEPTKVSNQMSAWVSEGHLLCNGQVPSGDQAGITRYISVQSTSASHRYQPKSAQRGRGVQ